jgi:hypothetical protein
MSSILTAINKPSITLADTSVGPNVVVKMSSLICLTFPSQLSCSVDKCQAGGNFYKFISSSKPSNRLRRFIEMFL